MGKSTSIVYHTYNVDLLPPTMSLGKMHCTSIKVYSVSEIFMAKAESEVGFKYNTESDMKPNSRRTGTEEGVGQQEREVMAPPIGQ